MLSAARAQRSCPQCRRQLLALVENTFACTRSDGLSLTLPHRPYRPLSHTTTTAASIRPASRPFSATRSRRQNPEADSSPSNTASNPASDLPDLPPDTIESIVRQARHAFGETLPKGYLNDEEYKLYLRLYGPPHRETHPEDVGMPVPPEPADQAEQSILEFSERVLLRETEDGRFEEVIYQTEQIQTSSLVGETTAASPVDGVSQVSSAQALPSGAGIDYINAVAKNKREFDALLKLQRDFEAASLLPPEEDIEDDPVEEEEDEGEGEEEDQDTDVPDAVFLPPTERVHEFSRIGHWSTNPSTLQLPKADFVMPITELLGRTDIKHVKQAAEKAFGGPGLPYSAATPASRRNAEQKPIPIAAGHHKMSEIEADTFLATMLPVLYSSTMSVLVEVRKRLGTEWMAKLMARGNGEGPRVLDVGGGGAGIIAWEQVLRAEWDALHGAGKHKGTVPRGKKTVVVGSEPLRQRVSRFLHNTTFLPRLPDYLHSGDHPGKLDGGEASLPRKQFDIIIVSHAMMALKEGFRRKAMLDNLWEMLSPEGGVLIVLEKGHPRGFEAVADVRGRILNEFIVTPASDPQPAAVEVESVRVREPGMIIAPCTNHKACPMYLTPGTTPGRKDFCHFSQRFIRPPFLQKILDASQHNHDDVNFSFIAVQRGTVPGAQRTEVPAQGKESADRAFGGYENSPGAPNPLSLPRSILPPLKRQGHVTLDVCTPAGKLERWTVPKSFSKQAYRDARKAKWGDLWALGAKTRVARPVRLGRGGPAPNDGGVRAQRAVQSGRPRVTNLETDDTGLVRTSEQGASRRPNQRRTKGGRKGKSQSVKEELEWE
ncbi:mitochondrial small ribosomal subunit Rsm22-domain-containing protein [Xylariaceae sp. FL0594]|nr:mitochondrial small ribosomal subunit Rsm22-domain-containing protein [Xylariaceae sp. FL0594]